VRSLEACDWSRCEEILLQLNLAEGAIASIYTESLRWTSTMTGEDPQP
jgi:hypothetical protein